MYVSYVEDITTQEACQQACSDNVDCTSWTLYTDKEICYFKTDAMASKLSNKWKSNVWSGKLENCELDIEWTRVCNNTGYESCIAKIVNHYELTVDPQPDILNGISDEDRELYDTFEDEFDCLDQFCPWTPTDTISGSSLDVNKDMLIQLFCNSELCTGAVDEETGRCDVDLRSLVDDFKNADPDQFLSDVFEVEVVDRLSKEQKVRFLFELKESSLSEMELMSEEEEEEEEKYEEMVVGDNEELQSSEKARIRLKKACNVKFDLVIDSENDIAIQTSDPKLKKMIKACNLQTKANKKKKKSPRQDPKTKRKRKVRNVMRRQPGVNYKKTTATRKTLKKTRKRRAIANKTKGKLPKVKVPGLSGATALADTITGVADLESAIGDGDSMATASAVFGLLGTVGAVMPPPAGLAVMAFAAVGTAVLGLFMDTGPSELEIMQGMIDDQTKQIAGMIDAQTEVLLAASQLQLDNNNAQTITLTNEIRDATRKLSLETTYQILDDMQGIYYAISIKKQHLDRYSNACIQSWGEVANTADLQHVNFQMGRLAAYTKRFCLSVSNLPFCKELLFQYMLLVILKHSVSIGVTTLVFQSKYPNHEYKLEALNGEQKASLQYDRSHLMSIFNSGTGTEFGASNYNPYCHVVCAFNRIPMNDEFDPTLYKKGSEFDPEDEMPFADGQQDFFTDFLKELGIYPQLNTCTELTTDELIENCSKCYVAGLPCADTVTTDTEQTFYSKYDIEGKYLDGKCEGTKICRAEMGQFTCDSGDCVTAETSLCNNHDDCEDGSDETEELCMETYPSILKWKIHGAAESGGYMVKIHLKVTPGGECEWFIGDPYTGDTGEEDFANCGDAGLYMGQAIQNVTVKTSSVDDNQFAMDYIEIENADGSRKWKIEGAPFNDWVSSDLPSDWHVIHEETSRMQKRVGISNEKLQNAGLRSIEDDYCEDIKEPEVCQSEGICDIKYYCSQCPETCGQCHNDKDVCSGKLKDCNIQPLCDNVCFDRRNETFCNQLKLDDGCNRSDDGCILCPKTCGTCHGGNEICPLKCKNWFDEEFCQNIADEGKCDDDEMLHYCTKTCTNCTESIFIPGH